MVLNEIEARTIKNIERNHVKVQKLTTHFKDDRYLT